MSSSRFGFTPFGLRASPPPSGWSATKPPERRPPRWAFRTTAALTVAALGAWVAMRTLPWFGPLVADGLRGAIGSEHVTELEEAVATVEDHVQQATNNGRARDLSDVTPAALLPAAEEGPAALAHQHRPANVAPPYPAVAAPSDGVWIAVPVRTGGPPALFRTLIHPDPARSYAELFVFALDLSKLSVHAAAGSIEPKSADSSPSAARPGIVPEAARGALVAAFNGGFKAEHGQFGMMVDGKTLLPPKPRSCTIAATPDGTLSIAPWSKLAPAAAELAWWRRPPVACWRTACCIPACAPPTPRIGARPSTATP
jgi:hypothetical protein